MQIILTAFNSRLNLMIESKKYLDSNDSTIIGRE